MPPLRHSRSRRDEDESATLDGPRVVLLEGRGRFLVGEPFFPRQGSGRTRPVTIDRSPEAIPGKLALVTPPRRGGSGRAKVTRIIGSPDVARDVIEAMMLDRGLRRRFAPGVEGAAGSPPIEVARHDLRDLPTFTIDPATAQDFDDAISAEALGDEHWRIWVHIADVSAYVRPGSPVDREAYARATSVYVPGAVEPMLPERLSNGLCSLVPGQDRLAVTVELEIRGSDVVKASFTRSTIRSDERLEYEQVDRIFAGQEPALEPWGTPLAVARAAAAALGRKRERQGALVIESTEPEFAFDRRGHVTSAAASEQTESHRLIEHLMIAANEAVAGFLLDRRVPTLYRVHEAPDPQRVLRLIEQLASLGVATPPLPGGIDELTGAGMSSDDAIEVVGRASVLVDEHVRRTGHGRRALTSLVLRALKQAHYSPANIGHSGLSSPRYCHFTSPIRRYPDLIAHRGLLSALNAGEEPPRSAPMVEAGAWTSARERDAMTIERDADDIARCFLLERQLFEHGWDQVFEGEVVGVIGAGAFVAFGDGYEGLLPVRRMRGDWWELNEEGTILEGERTGTTIKLGDAIRVVVGGVERHRGRVDLDVAPALESESGTGTTPRSAAARGATGGPRVRGAAGSPARSGGDGRTGGRGRAKGGGDARSDGSSKGRAGARDGARPGRPSAGKPGDDARGSGKPRGKAKPGDAVGGKPQPKGKAKAKAKSRAKATKGKGKPGRGRSTGGR